MDESIRHQLNRSFGMERIGMRSYSQIKEQIGNQMLNKAEQYANEKFVVLVERRRMEKMWQLGNICGLSSKFRAL